MQILSTILNKVKKQEKIENLPYYIYKNVYNIEEIIKENETLTGENKQLSEENRHLGEKNKELSEENKKLLEELEKVMSENSKMRNQLKLNHLRIVIRKKLQTTGIKRVEKPEDRKDIQASL